MATWICALAMWTVLAGPAVAQDSPEAEADWSPRARVMYSNFVAIRYNPLGLVDRLRISYRHQLFRTVHPLLDGAWVDAGAEINVAPTFTSAGARLEIRPLSILAFSATYEFMGYFGVLDAVMPIASTSAPFWEDNLQARGDNGENIPALGSRLTLAGTLQGKAGPIAIINTLTAVRVQLGLADDAPMMYDATQDLVLPNGGWGVINDLNVAALVGKTAIGVRYSYADALHGTGGIGDQPIHRVGPLVAYTFHDRPAGARFNKPTVLALLQWYASHVYRAGQERSAGVPMVAVALQFEGDLWVSRD